MDLEKLKKERGTARGNVTKLITEIADAERNNPIDIEARQIRQLM